MGMMKVIQAKREELESATYKVFLDAARSIQAQVKKIAKDVDRMDELRKEIADRVGKLDTRGVRELEDYKNGLETWSTGSTRQIAEMSKLFTRILPLAPVERLVNQRDIEVSGLMREFVQKHAGAFPKEVAAGMTFKGPKGEIFEVQKVTFNVFWGKQLKDGKEANVSIDKPLLCIQGGYRYLRG